MNASWQIQNEYENNKKMTQARRQPVLNVISACGNFVDSRSDFGHFRRLIRMLSQKALLKVERKYFKVLDAINEKKLAYRDLRDCRIAELGQNLNQTAVRNHVQHSGTQSNQIGMTVQEAIQAVDLCEQTIQKTFNDFYNAARKMGRICKLLESFQTKTPAFLVVMIGTIAWEILKQSFSCWWLFVIAYCVQLIIRLIGPTAQKRKELRERYKEFLAVLDQNKRI